MKDFALLILKQAPKFFANFAGLLGGPKSFVRTRNGDDQESLTEALTFFAVSFFVYLVLFWPLVRSQNEPVQQLVARGIFNLIMLAVSTAIIMFSFRLVGGRSAFGRHFVITSYYFGVSFILVVVVMLCALGMVKVFDLELYPILASHLTRLHLNDERLNAIMLDPAQTRRQLVAVAYSLFVLFSIFVAVVWLVIGRGAYREINGVSKARSLAAGVVTFILTLIVLPFALFIQDAIG